MHLLQTSIRALIDIGSYLCARLGLPSPRSRRKISAKLEEDGRVPRGTTDQITPIVGFRNRVVHLYDRVDSERVFDVLRDHRGDIERFLRLLLAIEVDGH